MRYGEQYSDRELFTRISEGNEAAFRMVFHKYNARLYPVLARLLKSEKDVEEVIQETFLKLWLNRNKLPEIDVPGAWLHTVASNLALTDLRKKAVREKSMAVISNTMYSVSQDAEDQLDFREVSGLIAQAVQQLPPSRKQIFQMSREQGLNRKEIARTLNISESTVKNQLGSALKFIQHQLEKNLSVSLPISLISILC